MQRMEQSKTLGPKYFKQTLSKSYQIVSWREEPGKKESLTPILFYFCSDRNCCSVAKLYPTLCDPIDCSTPGLPVHHQLPEFTQTHVHWARDAIQTSHPLPSPFPPASVFPSIRVFSNESALLIRWPKYWSFSVSISLSNEYSGVISFRMDWFDLLAVPRDSQESSPPAQFESINSSVDRKMCYNYTGRSLSLFLLVCQPLVYH